MSVDPMFIKEIKTEKLTYKLYYNNKAFRFLEREIGKPLSKIQEGINDLTYMLWAGLKHFHPEATIDTADEIIDEIGLDIVVEIVTSAIGDARPLVVKPGKK